MKNSSLIAENHQKVAENLEKQGKIGPKPPKNGQKQRY
jgi:hypothetical protein